MLRHRSALLAFVLLATPFLSGAGGCDCSGGSVPDAGPGKCHADSDCLAQDYCAGIGFCAPFNPDSDARGCLRSLVLPCTGATVCSNAMRACVPVCGTPDSGTADSGSCLPVCHTDRDCSDAVFCDGVERCMPGGAGSDGRGCVAASPRNPCNVGQTCNEEQQRCLSAPSVDADGDGHNSLASGGDDCDDNDANRFPGNAEVCDATGHDEDCNPSTYGTRDEDGDGFIDAACCNGTVCGNDCNDHDPAVHPNQPEVCNGVDDNCNGAIDEGVQVPLYRDLDSDGFGAGPADAGCADTPGYSELGNDCDDSNPAIVPGSIQCIAGVGNYELCTSDGGYFASKCQLQQACHPQPNGTGICF